MMNKRLLKESKVKKQYIPISVISSILNSIFIVFNAFLLALIVDAIFIKHKTLEDIKTYVVLFLVNALVKSIFNYFIEGFIRKYSEEIKENIKDKVFNNIILSNPTKVKDQKLGDLLNLLTEGAENITAYYSQYVPQAFSSVIIPIIILILVVFFDKLSALIMFLTYPIIPIFMALVGYKSQEASEKQWRKLNILSSHIIDLLQGLRTLKVFGKSKLQEEKIFLISEEHRKSTMEVLKIAFLSALVMEILATISTALVAVDLGLRLVYYKIDFFTAFFVLIITPEFYIPLRQLGLKYHSSLDGQVAIDEIEELEKILNLEDDERNKTKNLNSSNFEIEVNNLSFSHESKEALHNISFKLFSKEKAALVGASGSGKSTLINILSGFLKVEDNKVFINGVDINQIDREEFTSKIAIVPQFPHIFNMTIKENIILGNKSISDEKFQFICKGLKIDEFTNKFKNGYETLIGEGEEVVISGGEKQRIAMARALVKDAEFIVFDEPTSALDSKTEELLSNIFSTYFKDKTLLVAAHRLNTIKGSDKIIVLNKGNIVESGNHDELKNSKGFYYNMIKAIQE